MAFGLDSTGTKRAVLFVFVIVGGGFLFYRYLWSPIHEERFAVESHLERIEQYNTQARALTQEERVRDLRQREEEYRLTLQAYEKLLPSQAEVPGLLEDVARAALRNDVAIVNFAPLDEIQGRHLAELPYDVQIQGDYHDIGRFAAEVSNLERLVRPVIMELEQEQIETTVEDELDTYEVLATFRLSTFITGDVEVPLESMDAETVATPMPVPEGEDAG
jgi:Tfp pilus assembly protein PilO